MYEGRTSTRCGSLLGRATAVTSTRSPPTLAAMEARSFVDAVTRIAARATGAVTANASTANAIAAARSTTRRGAAAHHGAGDFGAARRCDDAGCGRAGCGWFMELCTFILPVPSELVCFVRAHREDDPQRVGVERRAAVGHDAAPVGAERRRFL